MKNILTLFILFTCSIAYPQSKKAPATQPYSIANIKLGMAESEFIAKYPDTFQYDDVSNSTRTILYTGLVVNNISIHSVILKFFKGRLIQFGFKTNDYKMHSGLSSKYGYREEESDFIDGSLVTIAGYGKLNNDYNLFRIQRDGEDDQYMMMDIKGVELSDKEGF